MNYFSDESEWQWLFRNAIEWDSIIPLYHPNFPTSDGLKTKEELIDFYAELLAATGDWTANSIAPRARALDANGAGEVIDGRTIPGKELQQTYKEAKELQAFGVTIDQKYGGLGAPASVSLICFTQLNRACISTATQVGFFGTIADMIERFCEESDKERLIPKIVAGEISGSMCLTEPGAGSDVGSVATSAVKQTDGSYLLNGSKIFISNGGGGLGFTLARVKGAPSGLDGISLFLVEQFDESDPSKLNYRIAKSEEKLGLHGSFTCEVVYENTRAKLIGKESEGFKYMLHLMNEARIGVGAQALGGTEACLAYAKEYAKTRKQFGKTLLELPLYKRNFDDWETERDAFRAMLVDTVSYFDMYQRLDLKKRHTGELTQAEDQLYKRALKWTRRRTPLVKYYGAEAFTRLSQCAIQALGGYGFIKEYDAERYHRDSFGPLLYEGTSQIQALMALKDLMKFVLKNPGKFFQTMVSSHPFGNWFGERSEHEQEFRKYHYEFKKALSGLLVKVLRPDFGKDTLEYSEIKELFNAQHWVTEEKFNDLMTHAETLCQALCYLETMRVLTDHADKDESRVDLLKRYRKLVAPRLAGIYTDWRLWER